VGGGVSHWFADVDDEDGVPPYVWQPCLETGTGHIPCFDVWFDSKEKCEDWIREHVIGAGLELNSDA
jgi:hypothetical protein